MREAKKKTDLAERLGRSAEAKKALVAKFRTKPTVSDPAFVERAARREAELQAVREAQKLVEQALLQDEDAMVAAKRAERKARKAQAKAEAQAKKEARSSLRKSRVEA